MAKDNRNSSKRSAADHRASHRIHSAASAARKKAAGFVRLSVWVPAGAADVLKGFAMRLCEGRIPDDIGGAQAGDGKITGIGVTPTRRRKKRKNPPCDERQLDLFGPV